MCWCGAAAPAQIFTLHEPLHLEVKDHDVMGASDPIGDVVLPLEELEFSGKKKPHHD